MRPARGTRLTRLLVWYATFLVVCVYGDNSASSSRAQAEVVYEWVTVDYDWPSDDVKHQFEQDGRYVPSHNLVSGVKTYKGQVYLSVPRLRYTNGVPSTLNQVVQKGNQSVLRPFPSWEWQELGNCSALQCAMSMEVDPISGHMYVIDVGRSGFFGDVSNDSAPVVCPAKLVVFDLADGHLVRSHDFPEDLVSKETNFLNDIVLDRGNALSTQVRWVHITDAIDAKLVTFSLETNLSHTVHHSSMDADPGLGSDITVNGQTFKLVTPIDGLAMSADFQYLYFCPLGSRDLYQVPSDIVRYPGEDFANSVRFVGSKISQTGGMTYATNNLFYGALTRNGVYRWEVSKDERDQGVDASNVLLKTETELVHDDEKLQWPDSFTIDESGFLWFTACRAQLFLLGDMDFQGTQGANFRVWRVNISEKGYLATPGSSL
ncbi:unnamed protein product [Candidula unifasciata]|uniref:Uncharacterized protein n=1 Tax=Candidula unifasciata TaxID=100452 RepID=A0A8S3YTW6_9EUPU|nr:unnamed protein product [Candidula unifasciata]